MIKRNIFKIKDVITDSEENKKREMEIKELLAELIYQYIKSNK